MSNETDINSRPTHRVYAVTGKSKKKFWRQIGALWPHADGKGFNLSLDYLPLNGAETVIRAVEATPEQAQEPEA